MANLNIIELAFHLGLMEHHARNAREAFAVSMMQKMQSQKPTLEVAGRIHMNGSGHIASQAAESLAKAQHNEQVANTHLQQLAGLSSGLVQMLSGQPAPPANDGESMLGGEEGDE